ncbi:MAG: hypothetical protein AAB929_05355 [Patescibacteria group bacterium]|mgnify:CR=1 FL=1
MVLNLSNKQLIKKYKEVFLEYESETAFGNFCARTLTRLLFLEKDLTEREYKIIIQSTNVLHINKSA